MEISVGLKKEEKKQEKPPSFEAPLGEAGPLLYVDKQFNRRMEENAKFAKDFFPKTTADQMANLSETKKAVLLRVNNMYEFLNNNVPHGKPAENPSLSDASMAIIDLMLMAQELALSDTPDEDVIVVSNDYFSRCYAIVWHTFDTSTNSVLKSFTFPPNPMAGFQQREGGGDSEDMKNLILNQASIIGNLQQKHPELFK